MNKKLLFATLLIALLLSSCGIDNTMFNARKYFKQAQDRPLTSSGRPSPQAIDEYTKTIQKCGVIITEKKGKKTLSEAVFLLARALYYKGNSAFQAKDQFEALINGFPESRHIPEAHIYLARVLRQLNRKQDAEKLLEGFVRDNRHHKSHARALMVLAEFEIEDQDYLSAQYWLQRIISDYPKTPEFKEASFLFGKNYYEQSNYAASFQEFEKLVNTRGVSKELKLEGRYYMALSLFELGDFAPCEKLVNQLLKSESRADKLALIRVIKARLLLQDSNQEKAIAEVEEIAKTQPRSLASSAAYYYLADYYFYQQADIDEASTNYGKVRTEFPTAIYADFAKEKADAVNQIKQNKNLSAKTNLQQFVDYHMLAADNYINAFALNDSALVMYQRIIDVAAPFKAELDSMMARSDSIMVRVDSLQIQIEELEAILPEPEPELTVETPEPPADLEADTAMETDSLDTQQLPNKEEDMADEEPPLPEIINEPEEVPGEPIELDPSEKKEEIQPPDESPSDIPDEDEEIEEEEELLINVPDEEDEPEAFDDEILELKPDEGEMDTPTPIKLLEETELLDLEQEPSQEEQGEDEAQPQINLLQDDEDTEFETDEAEDDGTPEADIEEEEEEEEDEAAWLRRMQKELEDKQDEVKTLNIELSSLETKIAEMEGNITRLDMEILPLVYFAKGSLLHRMQTPSDTLQALLEEMEELFPANKYTNAFNLLLAGKPVRLADPEEDRQGELLDIALGMYPDEPDTMRVILEELTQSPYSSISLKANFRLGWFYTFDEPDTTSAKPYLDEVINHPLGGEYADYTRKFYNGTIFQFPKPKPDSIAVSDTLDIIEGEEKELEDAQEETPPTIETEAENMDDERINLDDLQKPPRKPKEEAEDLIDAEEDEFGEEEQSAEPHEEQEDTPSPEDSESPPDEETIEDAETQTGEAEQPQPLPDGEPELE